MNVEADRELNRRPDAQPSLPSGLDEAAVEIDGDGRVLATNPAARELLSGDQPTVVVVGDPAARATELARHERIAAQLADAELIAGIAIWEWDVLDDRRAPATSSSTERSIRTARRCTCTAAVTSEPMPPGRRSGSSGRPRTSLSG